MKDDILALLAKGPLSMLDICRSFEIVGRTWLERRAGSALQKLKRDGRVIFNQKERTWSLAGYAAEKPTNDTAK